VLELRADPALVEAGALRLEVPTSELEAVEPEAAARGAPTGPSGGAAGSRGRAGADDDPTGRRAGGWRGPAQEARHQVDLRGLRVDEMEAELVRALDGALVGDLPELRIIHGKGTGALRQRVGELLEADPRVSDFRMGEPKEGGAGVTVARLRR
jgi:DNA mismatch repair protein MutS2